MTGPFDNVIQTLRPFKIQITSRKVFPLFRQKNVIGRCLENNYQCWWHCKMPKGLLICKLWNMKEKTKQDFVNCERCKKGVWSYSMDAAPLDKQGAQAQRPDAQSDGSICRLRSHNDGYGRSCWRRWKHAQLKINRRENVLLDFHIHCQKARFGVLPCFKSDLIFWPTEWCCCSSFYCWLLLQVSNLNIYIALFYEWPYSRWFEIYTTFRQGSGCFADGPCKFYLFLTVLKINST